MKRGKKKKEEEKRRRRKEKKKGGEEEKGGRRKGGKKKRGGEQNEKIKGGREREERVEECKKSEQDPTQLSCKKLEKASLLLRLSVLRGGVERFVWPVWKNDLGVEKDNPGQRDGRTST
ncbi:hypothetical protein Pmani_005229 [Petrolisthes manimaculis]|uniref:Uncharacterized protein n=1 Tax=Petrolisthes manimaculis TaxID=1843537 RepID=A0AAE1QC40_9EUCA|nr:hypothetical protein Pmani_005229 [Petrolisthes manimaculis]